jgi:hypothetical protein
MGEVGMALFVFPPNLGTAKLLLLARQASKT